MLGNRVYEKVLGHLLVHHLNMRKQCDAAAKKANTVLVYINRHIAFKSQEVITTQFSLLCPYITPGILCPVGALNRIWS